MFNRNFKMINRKNWLSLFKNTYKGQLCTNLLSQKLL